MLVILGIADTKRNPAEGPAIIKVHLWDIPETPQKRL
jgi:hypothetical protein